MSGTRATWSMKREQCAEKRKDDALCFHYERGNGATGFLILNRDYINICACYQNAHWAAESLEFC